MKRSAWRNLELKIAAVLLAIVVLLSVSLFAVFRSISALIVIAVSTAFVLISYFIIRAVIKNTEKIFTDVEREKSETEEKMRSIMYASPMPCHYWSRDKRIIDCNEAALELFGYKNKRDYIENWMLICNPAYQPDGQRTDVKGQALLDKAFDEGDCKFDWMHITADGELMPAEVTLVRVMTNNDCFVAGYTRDMRRERELQEKVDDKFFDELTGVYTNRYMEERATRVLRVLSRSFGELSVMMVSVDFLKPYYDAYGTKAGDDCMRIVTEVLRTCARRADDLISRYRNEDFIIILPNTCKLGAQDIAENLLKEMNKRNILHGKSSVAPHVTLSIGVTTGKVFHRQRIHDYINRAEEMLYIAKQSGRNRFSYADL